MALFPVMDLESEVQSGDMTRFDGSKSFITKGGAVMTTMTIKPGSDGSPISVFSSDVNDRYLDWVFSSFEMDVTSSNNKLQFVEGSTTFDISLAAGTYTLATLLTEILSKMNAEAVSGTFTGSLDVDDRLTLTSTLGFNLYPSASEDSVLPLLGFTVPFDGVNPYTSASTYTGAIIDGLQRSVTITIGDGTLTSAITKVIKVLSVDGDRLFSSDQDLLKHEPDIPKWVPVGHASFLFQHRRSQELIMAWLDEQGYTDIYGKRFVKYDFIDLDEVKQWSTFLTLRLIFESLSNAVDDIFAQKAKNYEIREKLARNRAVLRLDVDKNKSLDLYERLDISSGFIFRR